MTIYIYNSKEKVCISELSEIEMESLKFHPSSDLSQDILLRLHRAHQWLACDCTKPFALMYPRQNNNNLTIVNHYKSGVHNSEFCDFFSSVIGTDKEIANVSEIEDFSLERENTFMLFRGFGGKDKPEELPVTSNSTSSKDRVDTLIRILHNCVDKSYLNYFFGNVLSGKDIERSLMSLRDSSGSMFLKGSTGSSLQDIFFVGKKGLEIAESILLKKHKVNPNIRHSAIVILPSTIVEYESKIKRMSIVNDLDGTGDIQISHLNGINKAPILSGNLTLPYKYPALIIAALSFKDKHTNIPEALKVAIQPIVGDGSLCPVDNYQEAIFFRLANKLIHQEMEKSRGSVGKLYISKQLFLFSGDISAKPSIVLTRKVNNYRKSIYIEILISDSPKEEAEAKNRLDYLNKITSSQIYLIKMVMNADTTTLIQLTIEHIKKLIKKVNQNENE